MMKKAIIIASVASMIDQFNRDNINLLQELGYEVSVACNFEYGSSTSNEQVKKLIEDLDELNVKHYHVPIPRSMFALKDMFKSYKFLRQLALKEKYNLMHCHSPIGGVLARLAFKKSRRQGTRVIYTAHGFHFYDGAPLKNWIIFYPIEKLCSKLTDCLITINKEDYKRAKEKFYANDVYHINGIGVKTEKFKLINFDRDSYRKKIGLKKDEFMILSVGELNDNKNQKLVINSIAKLNDKSIHYFIIGQGKNYNMYLKLSNELKIENQIHLLGYRKDIAELNYAADLFIFPSIREGLGMAPLESLTCRTPVCGMNTRGVNEYVIDGITGFFFKNTVDSCVGAINKYQKLNSCDKEKMKNNCYRMSQKFSVVEIRKIMREIYVKLS